MRAQVRTGGAPSAASSGQVFASHRVRCMSKCFEVSIVIGGRAGTREKGGGEGSGVVAPHSRATRSRARGSCAGEKAAELVMRRGGRRLAREGGRGRGAEGAGGERPSVVAG